jgi:ketosteroid isomerase-like protein
MEKEMPPPWARPFFDTSYFAEMQRNLQRPIALRSPKSPLEREISVLLVGIESPEVRSDSVAVVRRLLEAFARRDVEAAIELVDPRFVLAVPGTGRLAGVQDGLYSGHAGLRKYFADVNRVWRSLEPQPSEFREHEDFVVAIGRLEAEMASGTTVDRNVAWAFRVDDDKVTWLRVYTDVAKALAEAGMPPEH